MISLCTPFYFSHIPLVCSIYFVNHCSRLCEKKMKQGGAVTFNDQGNNKLFKGM